MAAATPTSPTTAAKAGGGDDKVYYRHPVTNETYVRGEKLVSEASQRGGLVAPPLVCCRKPMPEDAFIEVTVEDPYLKNDHYKYRVFLKTNLPEYGYPRLMVKKRYNNFKDLAKRLSYLDSTLPSIPKADFFGRYSKKILQERTQGFRKFLDRVVALPTLNRCPILMDFFMQDWTKSMSTEEAVTKVSDLHQQAMNALPSSPPTSPIAAPLSPRSPTASPLAPSSPPQNMSSPAFPPNSPPTSVSSPHLYGAQQPNPPLKSASQPTGMHPGSPPHPSYGTKTTAAGPLSPPQKPLPAAPGGNRPMSPLPPSAQGYPPVQQQGGYPSPQQGQQGGYPSPQQGGYPSPQQQGGYPSPQQGQQGGYPPPQQQGGYPPVQQQGGYPPVQQQGGGYPSPAQQKGGYPPPAQQQGGYQPGQQGGYQGQQGGYPSPQQQGGYPSPQQQGGYPPVQQQGGYPPVQQQGGYPPVQQQGGYLPVQQQGGYPPVQQQGGYPPIQQQQQPQPPRGPPKRPSKAKVQGLYDFDAEDETELSFKEGDIITILSKPNDEWWEGLLSTETSSKTGLIPVAYIKEL